MLQHVAVGRTLSGMGNSNEMQAPSRPRIEADDSRYDIVRKALILKALPREQQESAEYVLAEITTLQLRDAYGSAVLKFGAGDDELLSVVGMLANELDNRIRRLEADVSGGGGF